MPQPAKVPAAPLRGEIEGVATELGGVLFLIHAVLEMDLESLLSESVGAWGLLEAFAISLVPPGDSDVLSDPVWVLLAECDGRSPGQPLPELTPAAEAAFSASALRLAAALDTDRPLFEVLLRRRGRLEATRSHIDLFLPLDSATAPVRLAGLDCNPGFVPVLGRVITFHYV